MNKWMLALLLVFGICHATTRQDLDLIASLAEKRLCIIVMRHGEALHDKSGELTSSRTPGVYLTAAGEAQIHKVAAELAGTKIDWIYVSPLFRTLQTAQMLGMMHHVAYDHYFVSPKLAEQQFGDLEGKSYREYVATFKNSEDRYTFAPPHGESGQEVFQRGLLMLKELAYVHHDQIILIITHAFNAELIEEALTGERAPSLSFGEYRIYDFGK